MAASRRVAKLGAVVWLIGAPACSLFVSVDGLSDGSADAAVDAQIDSAADSPADSGGDAQPATDASIDVDVDVDAAPAPIAFRALTLAPNGVVSATTVQVTRPASIQTDDFMIAQVYMYNYSSTSTPPDASWMFLKNFSDPTPSYQVNYYGKFATASEPDSYLFTTNTAGYASVMIMAYSNVNKTAPINASVTATGESQTLYQAPAVTTTVPNTFFSVSGVADGQSGATWTPHPAGDLTLQQSSGYVFAGDATQAQAGYSYLQEVDCSISSSGGIAFFALAPR